MSMYRILFIAALILIIISAIKRPKKMKLRSFNKLNRKNILILNLDKIIGRNKHLSKTKEKYISKLQVINYKSYECNNKIILQYIAVTIAISIMTLIALSRIITMWYAVITISFVVFYIIVFLGISQIESKINKIHIQFPVALQCFLDEYIIHKNIRNAINSSYSKMPDAIGSVFELLARELSGGKNYEACIKKFANELSYIWGHSFAEILLMSYEGSGDITDDLLTLNSMVSEEITADEEEKSSRYGNKMT
ncbi:MAG TPA: hypothetical protein DD434_06325, partial [Bacteroidales bacterium]|nr:hypothetical protein [Bacteroidales bacterium]